MSYGPVVTAPGPVPGVNGSPGNASCVGAGKTLEPTTTENVPENGATKFTKESNGSPLAKRSAPPFPSSLWYHNFPVESKMPIIGSSKPGEPVPSVSTSTNSVCPTNIGTLKKSKSPEVAPKT